MQARVRKFPFGKTPRRLPAGAGVSYGPCGRMRVGPVAPSGRNLKTSRFAFILQDPHCTKPAKSSCTELGPGPGPSSACFFPPETRSRDGVRLPAGVPRTWQVIEDGGGNVQGIATPGGPFPGSRWPRCRRRRRDGRRPVRPCRAGLRIRAQARRAPRLTRPQAGPPGWAPRGGFGDPRGTGAHKYTPTATQPGCVLPLPVQQPFSAASVSCACGSLSPPRLSAAAG